MDKPGYTCARCQNPLDARALADYVVRLQKWRANRPCLGLCTECQERDVRDDVKPGRADDEDTLQRTPGYQRKRYHGDNDDRY